VKLNILKPSQVGVMISFENNNKSIDKFGFDSEQEVIDFIKENLGNGVFTVYKYEKKGRGPRVLKPIASGDKDDLHG
jgi:hypothetical protein